MATDASQTGTKTPVYRDRYGVIPRSGRGEPATLLAREKSKKAAEDLDTFFEETVYPALERRYEKAEMESPLDIQVGRVLKTRVKIDKDYVAFGNKKLECKAVTAVGWWSQTTKNLEWGQGEWTTGWVWLKSETQKLKLTVPGRQAVDLIITRLWRFVGHRILIDIAQKLDNDQEVTLCGLRLNGEGMELGKLGAGKAIVPWKKIKTLDIDGKLLIESRGEKRRRESMSYRFTDNLPILDALLTIRRTKLLKKLSWSQAVRGSIL